MVREDHVVQSLQRMRVWMELRALKPVTISMYLRCTRRFIEHVAKPLDAVDATDVEQYLLELVRKKLSPRRADPR